MERLILLSFVQLIIGFCVSCKAEGQVFLKNMNENSNPLIGNKLKIKIGSKTFTATLSDNPTATAFKVLLPLTIKMNELNNNEKYADLSKSLPINASVPPSIQSGDLMMYGSRTLVLFYKGFSTSYSYTKIGKIDDVTGLAAALGSGDINIVFE
ncbi:MAG: cyclophilin-like fold protein [Emticicia sp.]